MKAVGLHPDVIVVTSRFWQTTCTLVRSGEEAFCIDSPVLPDELELLPAVAQQADFRGRRLPRHARRLGPRARALRVPRRPARASPSRAPRGCATSPAPRSASCATSTRSTTSSGRRRSRSPRRRRCRCPATAGSASASSSCTRPRATRSTGWRSGSRGRTCWSSATTSRPVEIPWISESGSASAYLATLDRLEPLVGGRRARRARPRRAARGRAGAGDPARGPRLPARRCSSSGADAPLPLARRTGAQKKIHAENVERVSPT